ncbi:hypothetical protein HDU85_005083 [Gaertneriomyces sp. JEL0708]|nr:hypothetical protein HDU85_005083 [Gaertneriomyces sp. JEL0708]
MSFAVRDGMLYASSDIISQWDIETFRHVKDLRGAIARSYIHRLVAGDGHVTGVYLGGVDGDHRVGAAVRWNVTDGSHVVVGHNVLQWPGWFHRQSNSDSGTVDTGSAYHVETWNVAECCSLVRKCWKPPGHDNLLDTYSSQAGIFTLHEEFVGGQQNVRVRQWAECESGIMEPLRDYMCDDIQFSGSVIMTRERIMRRCLLWRDPNRMISYLKVWNSTSGELIAKYIVDPSVGEACNKSRYDRVRRSYLDEAKASTSVMEEFLQDFYYSNGYVYRWNRCTRTGDPVLLKMEVDTGEIAAKMRFDGLVRDGSVVEYGPYIFIQDSPYVVKQYLMKSRDSYRDDEEHPHLMVQNMD